MPRTVEQIQFAPRMPKPLRVAAYARVSSGKDAIVVTIETYSGSFTRSVPRRTFDKRYVKATAG